MADAMEENSPPSGEVVELDPDHDEVLYLKYCCEGASSLPELVVALRRLASDLDARVAEGWRLADAVHGGWAHLVRDTTA